MNTEVVDTVKKLRRLYDSPVEIAVKKQKDSIDEFSTKFLGLSAFAILSTSSMNGCMDCSPRGDYPGFIQVLGDQTIAIPDRPGNNRLDSLTNIIESPNVGVLSLIPGFNECLRINGEAKIVCDKDMLNRFEYNNKLPKSVIIISIREIYFHCAKAIVRSKLWDQNSQVDRKILPSLGRILMAQVDPSKPENEVKEVEDLIEDRVKSTLY